MGQSFVLTSPVAFLVFNRPECTARVFERIRAAQPPILLIVADGPRPNRLDDAGKCAAVRHLIDEGIDWPCDVRRNYSPTNLGCRNRISSGLDWVFSEVEESIILEDDCLPHPDFFQYCQELLTRFRNVPQIGAVCGSVHLPPNPGMGESYYFSRHPYIWGWATWRRCWSHYDVAMKNWPADKLKMQEVMQCTPRRAAEWVRLFDQVYDKKINTWDYQWFLTSLLQGWLAAVPHASLVENIGFGMDATHTLTASSSPEPVLQKDRIAFPLTHPPDIQRNTSNDEYVETIFYRQPNRLWQLLMPIIRIFRKLFN